ncbi:MAG: FtsX-like permease family protein [Reichenbachiella sp.]|uniref:ABC transporter permease n=2 Tax=Reichenbachiella sp. TaxID=2184521 RepID=UPI003265357F
MRQLLRRISRNKTGFLIGQFSLILGISSSLIIFSFVGLHKSFDTFYSDSQKIHRVLRTEADGRTIALTEGTLKESLITNIANVSVTHFMKTPVDITFEYKDIALTESSGLCVDTEFFNVFDYQSIKGDIRSILSHPNSLVLTESLAKKIFGPSAFELGETVYFQMGRNKAPVTITGIIEDNPTNASLEFDYLISGASTIFWNVQSPWTVFNTFLKTNTVSETRVIDEFLNRDKNSQVAYTLQGITDIHLSEASEFDVFAKFDKTYLTILISTGFLILLVTLFNFLNLSFTQVLSRIREITTRKVLGTTKRAIIKSLFLETLTAIIFAAVLSVGVIHLIKGLIHDSFEFDPSQFHNPVLLLSCFVGVSLFIAILISMITFQIFRYDTQKGLKGKWHTGDKAINLGKLLLTLQLMVTLFSITYALVIYQQTNLLKETEVGYSYQKVLTIKRPDNIAFDDWQNLRQSLLQHAVVQSVGMAVFPSIGEYNSMSLKNLDSQENHRIYWIGVDQDYIPTLEIDLLSGRNFNGDLESDKQGVIINEKALELLGGEESMASTFQFRRKPVRIIGVAKNFHSRSLKEEVSPVMMTLNNPMALRNMMIRYSGINQNQMRELLNSTLENLNMPTNLVAHFMENDFNQKLLKEEHVLSAVSKSFSLIAITISFLGLFSYLAYTVDQKKKDFSIRKVLGATLANNWRYIMKEQFVVLLAATVLSTPVALYFLDQWRSQFIYQVNFSIPHLFMPMLAVLILIMAIAFGFSLRIYKTSPTNYLSED